MTIAAQQSGLVRGAGIAAILAVTAVYLFVRERRARQRRGPQP